MPKGPKPLHGANIGVRIEPMTRILLETLAMEEKRSISSMARILLVEAILVRLGDSPGKAKKSAAFLDANAAKTRNLLRRVERGEPVDPVEYFYLSKKGKGTEG
jgi:hypothetical protein